MLTENQAKLQKGIIHLPPLFILGAALVLLTTLIARNSNRLGQVKADVLSTTFNSTKDTTISERAPNKSLGTDIILVVNNTSARRRRSLLSFNISGIPGDATINFAKVRLAVASGSQINTSSDAGYLSAVSGIWDETTTWNTAPTLGTKINDLLPDPASTAGEWKEADVTSGITGDGTYDFYLVTDSTDSLFYTSKDGSTAAGGDDRFPELVIEWTTLSGPSPTPSPTPTPGPLVNINRGPYVGGVTDSEAVIFGRFDTEGTLIQVDYGTLSDLSNAQRSGSSVTTSSASDNTAHVKLTGLSPETNYYFAFVTNGSRRSEIYKFRTYPSSTASKDFNFVVFSDSRGNASYSAPAYQKGSSENPAFVMQIGDFRHVDPLKQTPVSVESWRGIYRRALGGTTAGDEFANYIGGKTTGISLPFVHIWDDHDYAKNNADKTIGSQNKTWAKQAFTEYFPIYSRPSTEGLWHRFSYAQADFFVLDLRTQRDVYSDSDTADKSMLDGDNLGAASQKEWLKQELLNSKARGAKWRFIVTPSVFNPHAKEVDSWFGFQVEQAELVNFINSNGIGGVILFSGDIHSGGAIDNGTNSYFTEMSIPNTNTEGTDCTGPTQTGCYTWSEGAIVPDPVTVGGGYALIKVSSLGNGSVTLEAKDAEDGSVRLNYTVNQ